MRNRRRFLPAAMRNLALLQILLAQAAPGQVSEQASKPANLPADCYLFTSFRGNGDGLHLAWSTDGLRWSALNNDRSLITPVVGGQLMRDPCIFPAPDGTFHMVWTTGWWDRIIGYANSKDLIHWSEQRAIPVMEHEPTAKNSWAPEITYDPAQQQYLIFWATTIPGRFAAGEQAGDKAADGTMLNHRIYCTTTRDFQTFTPTRLFFDPGFSVIDSTIRKDGDTFYMIFKDETRQPPKKHLRIASSRSLEGPYSIISEPFTPAGAWVEGPSLIKIGNEFLCYFDMYMLRKYGAMKSTDMKTWQDITGDLSFNVPDVRHGTAFRVDRAIVAGLLANAGNSEAKISP